MFTFVAKPLINKMLKILKQIILFVFIPVTSFSQEKEVNPPDYIKTINFKGNTSETQLPILKLGEFLSLEFDALNGDEADYYYKIKHFNYDWTPSVLIQSEFMEGFDNQRIRAYENSYNTYQIYSHYKLKIPNQFTKKIKLSGNYMLSVFNNEDELVFSRKFMIYENSVDVGVVLKRSRNIEFIQKKQRVEITVKSQGNLLSNPMQTVNVIIIQNNNLKTAITGLKPQYTVGNQLIYKYDEPASFFGGNEYFYFENKDVRAANTGIQYVDLQDVYHNYLYTNMQRADKPYTYNPDINGNYVVLNVDADNSDIEADYVWVHFSLQATNLLKSKNIYVYGNFNNYTTNSANKMHFNEEKQVFQARILLKQGFYNYKFVEVISNNVVDKGAISGDFYQTENNYKVLVYYRDFGGRYDKIIGVGTGSSVNISN